MIYSTSATNAYDENTIYFVRGMFNALFVYSAEAEEVEADFTSNLAHHIRRRRREAF